MVTDGLAALRRLEQATLDYGAVIDGIAHRGNKEANARRRYLTALKAVMAVLLGREPTDKEVAEFSDLSQP